MDSESPGHISGKQAATIFKATTKRSRKTGIGSVLLPTVSNGVEPTFGAGHQGMVLQSIVELLCSFYEEDEHDRRKLFLALCRSLSKMKLFTGDLNYPEVGTTRAHYTHCFVRLIELARRSIKGTDSIEPPAQGRLVLPLNHAAACPTLHQHSRYATEFEEDEFLAKGGFGAVYKARNRLDNCHYAIKKIVLKHANPDSFAKILREVTTLASLSHSNIVCYKTAWLEPYLSASALSIPHLGANSQTFEESSTVSEESSGSPAFFSKVKTEDQSFEVDFAQDEFSIQRETISNFSRVPFEVVFKSSSVTREKSSVANSGRIHVKKMSKHVVTLQELHPEDEVESGVDKVMGLATSPPKLSFNGGKFWDASNDGEGSCGMTIDPYWPKALLTSQEKKLNRTFGSTKFNMSDEEKQDKVVLFVQMQLCEKTLRSWLSERNVQGVSHIMNIKIFRGILCGVEYIHSKNIIHRDLKPRNVFISSSGHVQIGDFGLAKQELLSDSVISTPDPGLLAEPPIIAERKHHTSGVGTQAYASPEQLDGGLVDFKSDMYSLGIILFELYCCFTTAMERSKAISDLREKGELSKEFLRSVKGLEPNVATLIKNLTSPNPAHRPSSSSLLKSIFTKDKTDKIECNEENKMLRQRITEMEEEIKMQKRLIQRLKEENDYLTSTECSKN